MIYLRSFRSFLPMSIANMHEFKDVYFPFVMRSLFSCERARALCDPCGSRTPEWNAISLWVLRLGFNVVLLKAHTQNDAMFQRAIAPYILAKYLPQVNGKHILCVQVSICVCLNRLMSYSCNPCTALLFCQQSATFVMKSFYCDSTGFCVPHDCCFYLLFAQRFSSFSGRFLSWCTLRIGWRHDFECTHCMWCICDLSMISFGSSKNL